MPRRQNNAGGNISGKALLWVLIFLVLAGAGLFAAYTYYGNGVPPAEIAGNLISRFAPSVGNLISGFAAEKEVAAKKPDGHSGGGKEHVGGGRSVNDILGGPEFADSGKAHMQAAALRAVAPVPAVKASLAAPASEPDSGNASAPPPGKKAPAVPASEPNSGNVSAPPPSSKAPPVASASEPSAVAAAAKPAPLPPFPKTNAPTLNFMVVTPATKTPQPAASAKPVANDKPVANAKPVASVKQVASAKQPEPPPPPPPPPPKPRAAMVLPKVSGYLSDRADMKVNMSVEIAYEVNNALREELEFKRDMLATVASSVLRRHEYGNVNTAVLKTDILSAINEQLQEGKLVNVEIRDFQVGEPTVVGKQ